MTRPTQKDHYDHDEMTLAIHVADFLNRVYDVDSEAIQHLFTLWVACSKELHEQTSTVTRVLHSEVDGGEYAIGPLGLINGMLGDGLAVAFVDGVFKVCVRDGDPNNPEVV